VFEYGASRVRTGGYERIRRGTVTGVGEGVSRSLVLRAASRAHSFTNEWGTQRLTFQRKGFFNPG